MKWYLHRLHLLHLEDLKVQRGDPMEKYIPWVSQIANTFTREYAAIGALNYSDLVQAGYIGLVEAWENLDIERTDAEIWSFLKKRIKHAIRREIDSYGTTIKVPRRDLEEARKNLTGVDKILVNSFPKFFHMFEPEWSETIRPYEIERMAEELDDYLYATFKNIDHVEILRATFGIDRNKKVPMKQLAEKYGTTPSNIAKLKERMIKKLKADRNFNEIFVKYVS